MTDPVNALAQKLFLEQQDIPNPIVTFIAAQRGEGTSSIASAFTLHLEKTLHKKALLLDGSFFMHPAFADTHPPDYAQILETWLQNNKTNLLSKDLMHNHAFWSFLRETFDTVVIDAPSLQTSADGITLAAKSDMTVLVVAAEATREPVVAHLRDTLVQAGAQLAGIVMNKRRQYIPSKVYARL